MLLETSDCEKLCCFICKKEDCEENGEIWGPFWLCSKCNTIMHQNLEEDTERWLEEEISSNPGKSVV